jgi:hypothetical protein
MFKLDSDEVYGPRRRCWEPFKYPEPKKRFEKYQEIKVFFGDKTFWVNEDEFRKRYRSRYRLSKKKSYEKFKDKYKTVLNWLCVSYNEKELF